jgi:hypothetical protein
MPTIMKESVDAKSETATKANGLGVLAVLLGIAVGGALLASAFAPLPTMELAPDVNFFAP